MYVNVAGNTICPTMIAEPARVVGFILPGEASVFFLPFESLRAQTIFLLSYYPECACSFSEQNQLQRI